MKKILFFTPSCRRTGSEVVLYNLILNIDRTKFKPVGVVSGIEGKLLSQFESDIFTISFEKGYKQILPFIERLKIKLFRQEFYQQFLIKLHQKLKPDIWYINTIMQPEVLKVAKLLNVPCIVHSHELEQMLINLSDDYIQLLISYPKLIIACSKTAENVLRTLGRNHNIEVCYPSIDTLFLDQYTNPVLKSKFREKYFIPQDAFVWLMSGIVDFNKNPIRFIELAKILISQNFNVYFMWLGSDHKLAIHTYLTQFCKKLGISDRIRWIDNLEKKEYYEYFTTIDGFILTSTKESFSIVLLEALYLEKLVVSLNCGGSTEIIGNEAGTIIQSWNNEDISKAMIECMAVKIHKSYMLSRQIASNFGVKNQAICFNNIILRYFLSDI